MEEDIYDPNNKDASYISETGLKYAIKNLNHVFAFYYIIFNMEEASNVFVGSIENIAKGIKEEEKKVAKIIDEMEKNKAIRRNGNRRIMLNPYLAVKCSPEGQYELINAWNRFKFPEEPDWN